MTRKPKVLVGMSGGVDSSVSAVLLLEQGFEVIGAFMKNWSGGVCGPRVVDSQTIGESFQECDWKTERRDAARVAAKLGIPFVTFDFEKEYRHHVVEEMFKEFEAGRTPNPDVMCNKFIKFDRFVAEADRLGCDFIATGHYARVGKDGRSDNPPERPNVIGSFPARTAIWSDGGRAGSDTGDRGVTGSKGLKILKAIDSNKDQTYFLWAIKPEVLSRVLFPVGEMTKPEVREKAREYGLEVSEKKDSTGICFVGEVEMRTFLQERIPQDPGPIITTDGKVIGEHEGLAFYTIGQRHGLKIGGGDPYYVVEKRPHKKELIVSSNFHPALFKRELTAKNLNWFMTPAPTFPCQARIRYRQPLQDCEGIMQSANEVSVKFIESQRAVTPGQSIVFYDRDEVLGGGIIQ